MASNLYVQLADVECYTSNIIVSCPRPMGSRGCPRSRAIPLESCRSPLRFRPQTRIRTTSVSHRSECYTSWLCRASRKDILLFGKCRSGYGVMYRVSNASSVKFSRHILTHAISSTVPPSESQLEHDTHKFQVNVKLVFQGRLPVSIYKVVHALNLLIPC